jgi:hypothetical protein
MAGPARRAGTSAAPGASVLPVGRARRGGVLHLLRSTLRALGTGDEDAQQALRDDLEAVFSRYNRATDGTAIVENTYLETVATRE